MKRYKTHGYKRALNVTKGYRNKWQGRAAEIFFENECKSQSILFYKIHDPEDRKGCQLCDYIIFLSDNLPCFVDVKSTENPIRSYFYPPNSSAPLTSPQRQFANFCTMYRRGFKRTGFFFKKVAFDNDELFFVSTKELMNLNMRERIDLNIVLKVEHISRFF